MKELMNILEKDFLSEGFSKFEMLMFGVLMPAVFILLLIIVGTMQGWFDVY